MAKSIFKGTIQFGLVSIPVELYSAVKEHVLGFKLLHDTCKTPISYKRWCEHCNKEVQWSDIVKGLKLPDGTYFIATPENLKKYKPEKTDQISISEFIDKDAIATVYLENHYYVVPGKKADKAYRLFLEALRKTKRVAVAQFVMKDKQHVCMLEPMEEILLLTTLNYAYEVRTLDMSLFAESKIKIDKKELELAHLLMDRLYSKSFDIRKYKDTFAQKLKEALIKKRGRKILEKPKEAKKIEPSLISSLKESLESVQSHKGKR